MAPSGETLHSPKLAEKMSKVKSLTSPAKIGTVEKKTRQGNSKRTKFSSTSANGAKKRYQGQGK